MIFDFRHLGLRDVIMAAPVMREHDYAFVDDKRTIVHPFPVQWTTRHPKASPMIGLELQAGEHPTDYWARATGRSRQRPSFPQPEFNRYDIVLVPSPERGHERWPGWHALTDTLMRQHRGTVMLGTGLPQWQWIEALAGAKVVVTLDTPTLHMADLIGTARVVGLLAPDDTRPYWDSTHCIMRERLDDINVNDVLEQING